MGRIRGRRFKRRWRGWFKEVQTAFGLVQTPLARLVQKGSNGLRPGSNAADAAGSKGFKRPSAWFKGERFNTEARRRGGENHE